jgi:hypothetical protein
MHFTARLKETDPHDAPAIAPDVVPSTWADRVLADITRDAKSIQPDHSSHAPAPTVDTSFRAAVVARPSRAKWLASATMAFLFALGSAFAAAGWQHYGDSAKELIAEWTPQFALASSPPAAAVPVDQAAAPADQAAAIDQAAPPSAAAQPAEAPAVAAAAPSEPAELIQSMARDLAAMGQQIEQLKASIAELKANQQPVARTSEAKPAETRPAEIKPLAPAPVARPKVSAVAPPPPPRPAPPPVRRPPPVQASTAPIQLAAPPPPPPAAPPAQATARPDEEPVVRPPMPLRWGGVND